MNKQRALKLKKELKEMLGNKMTKAHFRKYKKMWKNEIKQKKKKWKN